MRNSSWVLGYHGCDQAFGEKVLRGKEVLRVSDNDWDWLGSGIYFWEGNARRAAEWSELVRANPTISRARIKKPFVLGAVINLGNCLDLLEASSIAAVGEAFFQLEALFAQRGTPLPANSGADPDRVIRRLDCAVINYMHASYQEDRQPPFDSVRAAFVEGSPLYPGAGFHRQTHIQLCVRREAQILGYFRVRELE